MSEGGGPAPQMTFIDNLILDMLDPEVVDGIQNSQTEAGVVSIYIFNFEVIVIHDHFFFFNIQLNGLGILVVDYTHA